MSHRYAPPGRNSTGAAPAASSEQPFALPYTMHYIALPVEPGERYQYKVRVGRARTMCFFEATPPPEMH